MSQEIDEKVVSMEFDNSNFEKNVSETISMLEQLKDSLDFNSSVLSSIDDAFDGGVIANMSSGVDSLAVHFETFDIVAAEVIRSLTDSAMSMLKQLSSFTIGSVVSGGWTRAMNLENARFQLQGLLGDEEAVEAVMDNVSEAVDGTAYSLDAAATVASQLAASGMTAGEEMTSSLRAVAGVAAMTNSEYSDIGNIFTTIAGNGRLMSEQLLQLSSRGLNAAATLGDYLGKTESEVREMVSNGEISFEIFAAAMDDAFGEHAKNANKTFTGALSNIKSALGRIGSKFYEPLIEQNGVLVKLFNALRLKINEFNENLDGGVVETVTEGISRLVKQITKFVKSVDMSENPIAKLNEALGGDNSKFSDVSDRLEEVTKAVTTAKEATSDFSEVVDAVISGEYGSGQSRFNALTEAGYDWAYVQNLVNEKLGNSKRYATDYAEELESVSETTQLTVDDILKMSDAQLKNIGFTEDEIETFRELQAESEKTGKSIEDLIADADAMNGGELLLESFANIGNSLLTILSSIAAAFRDVFQASSSNDIYNAIEGFHDFSEALVITDEGAEKIRDTFRGIFSVLKLFIDVVKTLASAALTPLLAIFKTVSPVLLTVGSRIGNILTGIIEWIEENQVLYTALGKVRTFLKSVFSKVLDTVNSLLELLGINTGALSDGMGSVVQHLTSWTESTNSVGEGLSWLSDKLKNAIGKISSWIKKIKDLPEVQSAIASLTDTFQKLGDIAKSVISTLASIIAEKAPEIISKIADLASYIVDGLSNGLSSGKSSIIEVIGSIASAILDTLRSLLGIASPSTEMRSIGEDSSAGLANGLSSGIDEIKGIFGSLVDWIKSIFASDVADSIESVVAAIALAWSFNKMIGLIKSLISAADPLSSVTSSLTTLTKAIETAAKAFKTEMRAKAVESLAKAIAYLAVSLVLLASIDIPNLAKAVIALVSLAAIMGALIVLVSKFGPKEALEFGNLAGVLVATAASVVIMTIALNRIASIDSGKYVQSITGLITIAGLLVVMMKVISSPTITRGKSVIKPISSTILQIASSMWLMASAMRKFGEMSEDELKQGITVMGVLSLFIAAFAALSKFCSTISSKGSSSGLGGTILSMAASFLIMVVAVKAISLLNESEIQRGVVVMLEFIGLIAAMAIVARLAAGNKMSGLGSSIFAMAAAMAVMALVVKNLGKIDQGQLAQGLVSVALLGALISAFVLVLGHAGSDVGKVAVSIISLAGAVGVLAVIAVLLGTVDGDALLKGVAAVAALGVVMALMVRQLSGIGDAYKTMIALSAAIAIMAAAVIVLSFLDIDSITVSVVAISSLMYLFSRIAKEMSNVSGASSTLILMAACVALLAGVLIALANFTTVETALSSAVSLTLVMVAFAAALKVVSGMGGITAQSVATVGVMVVVMGLIAAVLYILSGLDVNGMLASAIALSAIMVVLALVSRLASGSISGAGALAIMAASLILIAVALKALSDIPLESLVSSIGGLAATLIILGVAAAIFGAASSIMLVGAGVMAALGGACLVLGVGLMVASAGISAFGSLISSVFPEADETISDSSSSMVSAGWNLLAGLGQGLASGASYVFGILGSIGQGIFDTFCNFFGINSPSTVFAKLGGYLLEGLVSGITDGEGGVFSSITNFGSGLLSSFTDSLGLSDLTDGLGFSSEDVDTSGKDKVQETNAEIEDSYADLADSIGISMDDINGSIEGLDVSSLEDLDLDSLGLSDLTDGTSYSTDIADISGQLETELTETNTAAEDFKTSGEKVIKKFNAGITESAGTTKTAFQSVTSSLKAQASAAGSAAGKKYANAMGKGISNSSAVVTSVSGVITDVTTALSGLSSVCKSAGKSSMEAVASGMEDASAPVISDAKTIAQNTAVSMASAITSREGSFSSAGKTVLSQFSAGIRKNVEIAENAMGSVISAMVSIVSSRADGIKTKLVSKLNTACQAVRNQKHSFRSAGNTVGENIVSGLVSGMKDPNDSVYNAAYSLGAKAIRALKKATNEKSPSKEAMQIGKYFDQGFAIGIEALGGTVETSAYSVGVLATSALSAAIANAQDVVVDDLDMSPVITPVLDLTDVTRNSGAIGAILSGSVAGVAANVSDVGFAVGNIQNGSNADVVKAIKKLQGSIDGMPRSTTTIGNVTYDDGSNINTAVAELTRAARIERRR